MTERMRVQLRDARPLADRLTIFQTRWSFIRPATHWLPFDKPDKRRAISLREHRAF